MPHLPTLKLGSFRRLVLTGFSLVCLPLILALLYAALSVERLETYSRRALYVSTTAARASRALVEQVVDLERKARQYAVLGDPQALQAYAEREASVRSILTELSALALPPDQSRLVGALESSLRSLGASVTGPPSTGLDAEAGRYEELSALSKDLLTTHTRWSSEQAAKLQDRAARVKKVLLWLAAGVIPFTLAVALLFAMLIFRPVREIHVAIQRLGSGDLATRIAVHGPLDLEAVGARLDWLRRRLADSQEQKRKFLAHASHDLKTPLTAIREGADLLQEQSLGGLTPEQGEVAEILRHNSLRLQRSLQTLLDFSVAEARDDGAGPEGIALSALVESVLADHRPTLLKKEISLATTFEEATIAGNPERLRTVVDNLLSNAVKFTPVGGEISVAVRRLHDCAVIDVRDSGPGVGEDDRDRLFEAFYQGKSRSDGPIKGSGLGLSIAKEYAETSGGRIELVESRQGAHFRVVLPADAGGEPR